MVTECDDDHCEPGALRPADWNVTFGTPRCRGVQGGDACRAAFEALCAAVAGEFRQHDRIIQAVAVHYHMGAMHPFGDGDGRTARALVRDLIGLLDLSAITYDSAANRVAVNLDWPQQSSESELLERYEKMPSAASARHPAMTELSRLLGRRRT